MAILSWPRTRCVAGYMGGGRDTISTGPRDCMCEKEREREREKDIETTNQTWSLSSQFWLFHLYANS